MIPLPLEPDTLHDELKALRDILVKWEAKIDKEPLPGVDTPEDVTRLQAFLLPLKGELALVSARAAALAELLEQLF